MLSAFGGNNFAASADELFIKKLNKFYKASSFFLIKVFKDSNPCIIRSLILYQLCSRNNIKASLITGVSKKKGVLTGHSWIEINGEPFNEDRIFISNFT
ncbi:MAG: lasso peptide biosynthesis B2 protein, partial [Actinobacteria bacterium]|nr:lasso peptide biosynthesis B2 protein [Actinomycetota bacterium]